MRDTTAWKDVTVPSNVIVIQLDVTSDDSVTQAVNRILKDDGKIDIVINNAGYGMVGTLETVHIAEAQKMFDVNVWGVVRVLQAVLPSMRQAKRGHVIGISSTSGIRATPANEFYAGSKFALEGISEAMRYSLAAFNISVTNVNPGPVV
jgi:NADP-dependent 3-hydroxy acid dehydrogenase YdfG